ncbi:hypothetical protein KUTeg_017615 [Tegillarca granosa]|uniref:Neuroblastoma-amplified sequence N-terminal domain-containing protein n=1 Tax=Tegillarca granosa TaxID=220873 RepID=A0ABQ9EKB3_TEGGR|nr:hypothetical protein KUTeg_017615 [Tegillarca granosa]
MASEVDVEDDSESNILYDLTIHADWPQEAEVFNRGHQREKSKSNVSLIGRLTSGTQRAIWTFLRTLGIPIQTASPCFLPVDLVKLINCQINWHVEVGSEGKVVAILQDQCVEIRSKRDNYESIIGRGIVPRDPYPQWRHLAWSPDNTMLACSQSNGTVDVFDLVGTQLFSIEDDTPKDASLPLDLSCAVAGLIFTDHKPGEKWSSELLVVNFHGSLRSYFVDRDNGFVLNHSFVFNQQYPRGIGAVTYHPETKLLIVGGIGSYGNETATKSVQEGLTAWRNLSDYPHYKLVTDYEQDSSKNQQKGLMKRLTSINLLNRGNQAQDGIFNMCLSPDKKLLATLHHSGKLSIWHVPSLKLFHTWNQEDQPGFDEISPEFTENPRRNKTLRDLVTCKNLLDVNWWNKQTIILARSTGAITLSSVKTLKNLLGNSPEWFEPAPRVTPVHDGGFLGLEVESKFPMKRRLVGSEDDDYEDSDDEDVSLVTKAARFSKNVLYYVTDNERFQPPRKKPKIVNRTYRLICLKSTTPEELYARKIDNEEYGEALALAKAYNLDSDLVYQRQWKKSVVSMASIQDYLSKINKRSWVLHECLERIPENIDATKELLEFGLRGTDLQALVAIGKGEDGGRFILCDLEEGLYEDMSFDDFNPEDQRRKEELRKERQEQLLSQVDFSSLNLEQRELCRVRLKLLQYLYRLKTYECILGGESAAAERFNHKFFQKFRSQNIVEAAVEYARNSDWKALEILMTYHGEKLSEHRLSILSNFSETTSPSEYKYLLPEVNDEGMVVDWNEDEWREKDWSEFDNCRLVVEPTQIDLGASLYEENPELQKFRAKKLTKEVLSEWYIYQAFEIERCSRLVDSALELIKLGLERGIQGLNDMLDDLVTMEMLVYECNVEDTLTFEELRQMADYDKLELIMSKSTEEMYTKNLHRWMVPFLSQCERRNPGSSKTLLRDYIITLAKSDFTLCLKIFESSKTTLQNPLIRDQEELLSIALEALYACEREDQLNLAVKIVQCLPEKTRGKQSSELVKLHKDVDRLERHIRAAKILEEHGARKPLYFIKDSENEAEEAKNLMIRLTRTAGRRGKPLSEREWMKLYEDILILQDQVYRCISAGLCQEIFTESLLCSERKENIILAGDLIERKGTESEPSAHTPSFHKNKVHYDRSVHLVLSAAQEYFNSSANLMDPCMDLARTCLNLILDTPAVIQEELDLIASLALLDDFGVMILPLQVRLSKGQIRACQNGSKK